jgi:hypothetical protein
MFWTRIQEFSWPNVNDMGGAAYAGAVESWPEGPFDVMNAAKNRTAAAVTVTRRGGRCLSMRSPA